MINAALNKEKLIFVCKSYERDYESFCRLFSTYKKYNVDNIPLYVSVPKSDLGIFQQHVGDEAVVISDESYAEQYFTSHEYWGLSRGYINQEICKLTFWKNEFSDNYLCIDSDLYFIREFYIADFMANETTPYSVLVMDKDLNTERFYRDFSDHRQSLIKKIFDTVGYHDERLLTCHGMTVLNSTVLRDFNEKFMNNNNFTYEKLIEISPYEYSWYNAWLQKSQIIDVVAVEPFFKTFHVRFEYELSRAKLISEADLSRRYIGVILNSNWQPKGPPEKYIDPNLFHKIMNVLINKIG